MTGKGYRLLPSTNRKIGFSVIFIPGLPGQDYLMKIQIAKA